MGGWKSKWIDFKFAIPFACSRIVCCVQVKVIPCKRTSYLLSFLESYNITNHHHYLNCRILETFQNLWNKTEEKNMIETQTAQTHGFCLERELFGQGNICPVWSVCWVLNWNFHKNVVSILLLPFAAYSSWGKKIKNSATILFVFSIPRTILWRRRRWSVCLILQFPVPLFLLFEVISHVLLTLSGRCQAKVWTRIAKSASNKDCRIQSNKILQFQFQVFTNSVLARYAFTENVMFPGPRKQFQWNSV